MLLQILYGNQVEHVTAEILRDVSRDSALWPNQRGLIIVPENRKLTIERSYLLDHRDNHLMMAEVLSFNRLAMRILSEVGLFNQLTLNAELSAMIIRRIMYEHAAELSVYGGLRYNRYFLQELNGVINELVSHNVNFRKLRSLEWQIYLRGKLKDLALIGDQYQAFLVEHKVHDPKSWLEQLHILLTQLVALKTVNDAAAATGCRILTSPKLFLQQPGGCLSGWPAPRCG